MAYMSQQKKQQIAAELKGVIPKNWKYSLSVNHSSTIVLTIWKAPFSLASVGGKEGYKEWALNPYWWRDHFRDAGTPAHLTEIFEKIFAALNNGNHNRSDPMTDYYDVGWYVDVYMGRWDKPFEEVAA